MVQAPGFFRRASLLVRLARSGSVALTFNRSPSASIRKLDRIGMVVLRSTTLCVAVSSFTRSWRLTVISIAAPCTAGFSTSVSMIGIGLYSPSKPASCTGHTLQHNAVRWKWLSFLLLDCIHLFTNVCVENMVASLDSMNPKVQSLVAVPPFRLNGRQTLQKNSHRSVRRGLGKRIRD